MSNPLHDKILLYRVRTKRDPVAFGKIYDLYVHRIYRFVYFKVSSVEEAQDITADVFLKAWSYLIDEKGQEVRHLSALLYRMARNRVIDYYRSQSHEALPLSERAEETVADGRMDPSKTDAKIDMNLLEKHLRSLKDEYREVLVMKYLDELETSEIANILGKNHGNVRVLLHRALAAVRELVPAEKFQHETAVRGTIEGFED
jgi:RNA polymerase sigma-70 factor (ECF subfamily)